MLYTCPNPVCTSCPAGKSSPAGSDALDDCVTPECAAGCTGPDGGPCAACVAGKYKATAGSAACTDCAAGKYNDLTGRTTDFDCLPCPDGATSPPATSSMQQCTCLLKGWRAAVYVETIEGYGTYYGPENRFCICLPGFARDSSGWCQPCVAGKYKATAGIAACTDCGTGKYSATEAADTSSTCIDCAPANTLRRPVRRRQARAWPAPRVNIRLQLLLSACLVRQTCRHTKARKIVIAM